MAETLFPSPHISELVLDRRDFLKILSATGAASTFPLISFSDALAPGSAQPGRIPNEFSLFLPGEAEALRQAPQLEAIERGAVTLAHSGREQRLAVGEHTDGWLLASVFDMNGVATAVFEKHVTHRGALAFVTVRGGTIALIPKGIGDLSKVRPRPVNTSAGVALTRPLRITPGPDVTADFLLRSQEDPCYENVAALGPEYVGWTLVSSEGAGPMRSLYLQPDCTTREPKANTQEGWAPDMEGAAFDPADYFPFAAPEQYEYKPGYSKRTLLGGYLPVADTGVWNPEYNCGYELTMLLPPEPEARPIARMRVRLSAADLAQHSGGNLVHDPDGHVYALHFWNTSADAFYRALAGTWNHWHSLYEEVMPVEIPDPWLLDAARAGITLSRCSYRGLEPTYQVGEGAYTKIPERSHALFPVAHYEYIWAHQLWGLTEQSRPYAQHYLDKYVLPDGNFLYNTQDQVEGPLNVGIFLMNAARDFWYTRDASGLLVQRPVLERMLGYVLARYAYSKEQFAPEDRRYGLIWGSPEADLGETGNDYPSSHPYYYQNAACVWRGLHEYAKVLRVLASDSKDAVLSSGAARYTSLADEMRANVQRSLEATIAASTPVMRAAGITPFEPNDIHREPSALSSYENHRFMMDWFLADWGVPALDEGHLKHRRLAGQEICGLHTDGDAPRTSNFMEHGTLAVKIRRDDYRSYLLTLYALVCYAADSGNRYAPEDAYIPGSHPGEQSRYGWSAVINSTLQPTLGLRWLLCYEENDVDVCHLQKAAPRHWFSKGQHIAVSRCPTRFGTLSWRCEALDDHSWQITLEPMSGFAGDLAIHIHPPSGARLASTSLGALSAQSVLVPSASLSAAHTLQVLVKA